MASEKRTIRVLVTGAAGQIGYALLPLLASGNVFGHDQPIILHLLDIPNAQENLRGVAMEIQDCGIDLVRNIITTSSIPEAFQDVDVAIMLAGSPRKPGMERKDVLEKNASIFQEHGQALQNYASPLVKVLVVANPANTNALILSHNAPKIPRSNITCLMLLDWLRGRSLLAQKLKVNPSSIKNFLIWGNHSSSQVPDITYAWLKKNGKVVPVRDAIDEAWLKSFSEKVQQRGAEVLKARGLSSAMSASNAIAEHLKIWLNKGTPQGEFLPMGILSDGSYGICPGIVYSFPVYCKNREWSVVRSLPIHNHVYSMMKSSERELLEEKELSHHRLHSKL